MAKPAIKDIAQFEQDVLNLETAEVMKKYKIGKQAVYDKRYALKKKGTVTSIKVDAQKKKRGRKAKAVHDIAGATNTDVHGLYQPPATIERASQPRDIAVIHKPIEINFDNFSIKLNGVPRRISVNPETNAIEIDL